MLRVKGIEKAKEIFAKFAKRIVRDINPFNNYKVLVELGEELVKISNKCFTNQSSPDGRAWEPLKESTIRKREYSGFGKGSRRILFINGKLKNSVAYYIKGKSIVIGSPLKFAHIHMQGDKTRNIPSRPFLGTDNDFRNNIGRIIYRYGRNF
ncbi:hypothetical protein F0310_04550 (plasmid) [Borrelia sp. A-FGy1]|uniref:phage virion morphogenesis protein n=1 Tax=Borrelia sp. A-FGy1 TaxID=2608247 RepID=UPI0015F76B3A|nr:phage virion morphogenesis protein [Borrelia sp. A-FGy1]QMU99688.1 hypothetical protein F0310_04550 [Borrelia sp. A-FGy1]